MNTSMKRIRRRRRVETIGGTILFLGIIVLNFAFLALGIAVIVWTLRALGVL